MNFFKLVIDDGKKIAGTIARDTDSDFSMGLVFEDFGAGTAVCENDSSFPDEGFVGAGDVFDLAVHC